MLKIVAIGHKMPAWIQAGFLDYQKRLKKPYALDLIEISSKYPESFPADKLKIAEAELLLAKIPQTDFCIALDPKGESLDTEAFAKKLSTCVELHSNISFMIGGREGLDARCLTRANWVWSLSQLIFPHQLVKVILAEQLYRAVSVIEGHPYHRA